jgi:hypothetical protein
LYSGGPGSLYLEGRLQDENREASTAVTAPWIILEALAQHVSRYDDAGPDRNIMDRPDQQNHPITRSLAILLTALLESATASVNVRSNHDLIIYERRRACIEYHLPENVPRRKATDI